MHVYAYKPHCLERPCLRFLPNYSQDQHWQALSPPPRRPFLDAARSTRSCAQLRAAAVETDLTPCLLVSANMRNDSQKKCAMRKHHQARRPVCFKPRARLGWRRSISETQKECKTGGCTFQELSTRFPWQIASPSSPLHTAYHLVSWSGYQMEKQDRIESWNQVLETSGIIPF